MKNKDSYTDVYRASGEMEAQVIKGLLESHGIPCVLSSHAAPSVHVLTVNGLGEVRVIVPGTLAEAARKLIRKDNHA